MAPARASLSALTVLLALTLGACSGKSPVPGQAVPQGGLIAPCARAEAEAREAKAAGNPAEARLAAACYAYLYEHEAYPPPAPPLDPDAPESEAVPEPPSRSSDAARGRAAARLAAQADPQDGTARYLLAYLTGLAAESNPWIALDLVPVIEQEALQASRLAPGVDNAGPDRALGDLYLRAPGPPLSLGDPEKAVRHYRRAVELAPGHAENRLGLAQSLLAEEEHQQACQALEQLFALLPPADAALRPAWEQGVKALKKLCSSGLGR